MSYQIMKNLYDSLINNINVTNLVPAGNISVGWRDEIDDFPVIMIIQAGGSETGQLGYKSSDGYSQEEFRPQIEILSQHGAQENYKILDSLTDVMISSGYEKTIDNDMWSTELSADRKITTWRKIIYNDK